MKILLKIFFPFLCLFWVQSNAQVTNYSLNLDGSGNVNIGTVEGLKSASQFTVQAWINPVVWTSGSSVLSKGAPASDFSLSLGSEGEILVSISGVSVSVKDASLKAGEWHHLTVVYNGDQADKLRAYVDNIEVNNITNAQNLPAAISSDDSFMYIGERFNGRIDELRIWDKALSPEDFYYRNTLNKFHPSYSNLIAYYKFDQNLCPNIVDYINNNNGIMENATRVATTDNRVFRYRILSGYTDFNRYIDGAARVDKNMFTMTNDLIILAGDVYEDGKIHFSCPENEGVLQNTAYLSDFAGRSGVLNFKGSGASMNVGPYVFTKQNKTAMEELTFQGWFYINNWVDGAIIISQKNTDAEQISITLGDETERSLVVNVNGMEYIFKNHMKVAEWQYFGIKFNPGARTNRKFTLQIDGDTEYGAEVYPSSFTLKALPLMNRTDAFIGTNFDGKMDEVMIWEKLRAASGVTNSALNGYVLPSGNWDDIWLNSYWKCDDAANPGKNYKGWKNMVQNIRDHYKGYRGMKVRLGLLGRGDWKSMVKDADKRAVFAQEIKDLVPYFDGFDVDFEWLDNNESAYNQGYGPMVEALRAVIPTETHTFTVSLHAVSYALPKKYIDMVDYVTFQIYGPSKNWHYYNNFIATLPGFRRQGFPDDKILLSPSTLASTGTAGEVKGYKDIIEANPNLDPNLDDAMIGTKSYAFNGVNTVKKKMNFIMDEDIRGVMYFDMANDLNVADNRSIVRTINSILASNVDSIVTEVGKLPSSIRPTGDGEISYKVFPNPTKDLVNILINDWESVKPIVSVFNATGVQLMSRQVVADLTTIDLSVFGKGIYFVQISTLNGVCSKKIQLSC